MHLWMSLKAKKSGTILNNYEWNSKQVFICGT